AQLATNDGNQEDGSRNNEAIRVTSHVLQSSKFAAADSGSSPGRIAPRAAAGVVRPGPAAARRCACTTQALFLLVALFQDFVISVHWIVIDRRCEVSPPPDVKEKGEGTHAGRQARVAVDNLRLRQPQVHG